MPDIKIDPVAGAAWVAALEGGTFPQDTGHLKGAEGGYCCLGVFAKTMGATEIARMDDDGEEDNNGDLIEFVTRYDFVQDGCDVNEDDLLAQGWADRYGVSGQHQTLFSCLNDGSNFVAHVYHSEEFSPSAPFYPLMQALANDPTTAHGRVERLGKPRDPYHSIAIHFRKHSFREIAEIIKVWML